MKRAWIILATVAASAVILVIMFWRDREPRYHGRALSSWIEDVNSKFNSADYYFCRIDPKGQSASNAVYQIGANALPTLLKWAFAKDSRRKAAVIDWLDSHPSLHFHIRRDVEWQTMAREGFELLGDKVESAWPMFVQYTYSEDSRRRYMALTWLDYTSHKDTIFFTGHIVYTLRKNTLLLPVTLRLVKDPDQEVQHRAARILIQEYPKEAEAAGVFKVFPELRGYHVIAD
jgi:hypothetical protein